MIRYISALAACTIACGSGDPRFPDESAVGSQDAGNTVCTVPDAGRIMDASPVPDVVVADVTADVTEEDAFQGPPPVQAPWALQDCWFGPPAYLAVPPCPHGVYVECFANEAGGGLGYCDDTTLACHLMMDGTYHCPAGTRTTNTACALQTDSVAAWPSTYTYVCTGTAHP